MVLTVDRMAIRSIVEYVQNKMENENNHYFVNIVNTNGFTPVINAKIINNNKAMFKVFKNGIFSNRIYSLNTYLTIQLTQNVNNNNNGRASRTSRNSSCSRTNL